MAEYGGESNDLVRYLAVPLRRWRLVSAVVVLGVLLTSLYVFTRPEAYTSTSLVDLNQITTSPFDATKSSDQLIDVATEAKTATSQAVAARASQLLSGHPSITSLQQHLAVTAPSGTTALSMAFTAASPAAAAAGANAFAQAYLYVRQSWAEARRQSLIDTINDSAKDLRSQLTQVNKSLAGVDPSSAAAQDALTTRTLLTQQFSDLSQRENALTGMSIDPGQVVTSATPGTAVASSHQKLFAAAGFLIFLVLGLIAALAREALDRRLRSPGQLEEILDAGVVSTNQATRHLRAALTSPDDAMYVLRSRVLNAAPADRAEVLVLIDCSDPTTAGSVGAQLAQLMANTGAAVRLIMVAESLDMPSWYSSDDTLFGKNSRLRTDWLRLSDPDNVLEQNALTSVLDDVRRARQIAIVATVGQPRRSLVVALSSLADDVIVVAQAGRSDLKVVRRTAQDVSDSGTQIFGGVLVRSRRRGGASNPAPSSRPSGQIGAGDSLSWVSAKPDDRKVGRPAADDLAFADAKSVSQPRNPNTIPLELRLLQSRNAGNKAAGQTADSASNAGQGSRPGNDSRPR